MRAEPEKQLVRSGTTLRRGTTSTCKTLRYEEVSVGDEMRRKVSVCLPRRHPRSTDASTVDHISKSPEKAIGWARIAYPSRTFLVYDITRHDILPTNNQLL